MTHKTTIDQSDILGFDIFETLRKQKIHDMILLKKKRRLSVGPYATFYFESYDTIWWQIHEMLRIEKGGKAQEIEELEAYRNLVPNGYELIATLMFEIEDADERLAFLSKLGGAEHHIYLNFAGVRIKAEPEADLERTSESGKTSSVHFLHFKMTPEQSITFKNLLPFQIKVEIDHPLYPHSAGLSEDLHASLCTDLL